MVIYIIIGESVKNDCHILYEGIDFEEALKIYEDEKILVETYKEKDTGVSFNVAEGERDEYGDVERSGYEISEVASTYVDEKRDITWGGLKNITKDQAGLAV